ncbi:HupE/UreJ family protein [bacterium]|nr:HupE/UreJ family protein [bacterium]
MLPLAGWAHGIPESEKLAVMQGGLGTYLRLGAVHMLTGYDHLLFLLGIVFYLDGARDVVKYVTLFTLGHSLTLTLATLYHVQANEFLIDAIIALSVCYKAFDNLDWFSTYLKVRRPNLSAVVFGFGLIHGFGLSTRLQELPIGHHHLAERIMCFNLGIEVGQLLALALILMLLRSWRRTKDWLHWSRISNHLILLLGSLLFLVQMHDYIHSIHPEHYQASQIHEPAIQEPHHDSL